MNQALLIILIKALTDVLIREHGMTEEEVQEAIDKADLKADDLMERLNRH